MVYGTANPRIHKVIEKYGSAMNAYTAITDGDLSTLDKEDRERLKRVSLGYSEQMLEYCRKNDISVCALGDKEYPKLLKEIYDPPLIFFYRGDLSCLDALSLTFVGAREATPYITRLCARMTRDIAGQGVTIVSGMAHGVDECAHMACVANDCKTVAVLACGIEVDYPFSSTLLRNSIVDKGGAYISELLPREGVTREYFNPRNRILAGLTRGTVVFQASERSGSLITANYAFEENRDVFCVPPPDIYAPEYAGVVGFLRDGAIPVFNHDDILNEYRGLYI